MTRRSSRELERAFGDLYQATSAEDGDVRELSGLEKHLLRWACTWRIHEDRFDTGIGLEPVRKAARELLDAAVEESDGDEFTIADIDAAVERLGIDQYRDWESRGDPE
jgi:hypothetical protein